MFSTVSRTAISIGLLVSSYAAIAGDTEDRIIDKAIAAYGGTALTQLKTLRINDNYKGFREGQSRSPNEIDQVSYQTRTTIDFVNRRKSMQSIGGVYVEDLYIQHVFFDGETGYHLRHPSKTASKNPRLTYARADRGLSWRSDLALAKLLSEFPEKATYEGEDVHQGKPQQRLTLHPDGYPAFTLFIDKASGLISKMTRPDGNTGNQYSYVFSDYRRRDGVTFAADTYVMRGGKPESLTASRSVDVNMVIDDAYALPASYGAPAAMYFYPEMSVQALGEGVYLAGKDGGFSIFVDADDYFIASGGYPGLQARLAAVHSFLGTDKPLKYQIVTHHHTDHIGGLREAADLGVTFITAAQHIDAIRSAVPSRLADDRFLIADKSGAYADGRVRVVDIASWHANHNLVTYIPHARVAFSADHFFTNKEAGTPNPAAMYADFKGALDTHGLKIDYLAAAHSGRVLTYDDLVQSSTKPFVNLECPKAWDFCSR